MNTNQNIKSLAERIKISILNQGKWSGTATHKRETMDERSRHNTQRIKKVEVILTQNAALKTALAIKSRIYTENKRLTLPSPVDGMRIVPMCREFEHSATISKLMGEEDAAVAKFISQLPEVIEEARVDMNGLFDASMFPTAEELKVKFYNKLSYLECPVTGSWEPWLRETLEIGRLDLQSRITTAARHLVTKIKDYDIKDGAKLYESVLDNLHDICELSVDFNLSEDPIIAQVSKELSAISSDYSVETLRNNQPLRKEITKRTENILSMLDFRK